MRDSPLFTEHSEIQSLSPHRSYMLSTWPHGLIYVLEEKRDCLCKLDVRNWGAM